MKMKLSIIIPALNEAAYLPETILKAKENASCGGPFEIIVVDSGSVDGTSEIASRLGAKLLKCDGTASGKAVLLNKGAELATGDVYLFLDADTFLPEGYDASIEKALSDPAAVGGAFEFSLDGKEFGLRVVEIINRMRYSVRQRYYGDQGIYVRSEVFNRVGGYPPMRLMEAAHLCKALRAQGRLTLIHKDIKTSPRRFLKSGIYTVLAEDIKIWFLDLLGITVDKYADRYWEDNRRAG